MFEKITLGLIGFVAGAIVGLAIRPDPSILTNWVPAITGAAGSFVGFKLGKLSEG